MKLPKKLTAADVRRIEAQLPARIATAKRAKTHLAHTPGEMNGTERRYSEYLEIERIKDPPSLAAWWFEPIRLRLAIKTFYTPDFLVQRLAGGLELVDVKGRPGSGPGGWTDDARVKIKVAARLYPLFDFIGASWLTKKQGGPGWKFEKF